MDISSGGRSDQELISEDVPSEISDRSRREQREIVFQLLYMLDIGDYQDSVETLIAHYARTFTDKAHPIGAYYGDEDVSRKAVISRSHLISGELQVISLLKELAQGRVTAIADARNELDEAIKPLLHNWKFDRLSVATKLILRFALWELTNTSLASAVVINEAIELAKCFAEHDSHKFVNGILDEWVRRHRPEELPVPVL